MAEEETVTLTLTGAERCFVRGFGLVERYKQAMVDPETAEHLLDQYYVDGANNEYPMWEEGVVEAPPARDRAGRRVRRSARREERAARRRAPRTHDDADLALRSSGSTDARAQDPYGRSRGEVEEDPDEGVDPELRAEFEDEQPTRRRRRRRQAA